VKPRVLLCSDLDRTLIPNGVQEESANARGVFSQLAQHPELKLAYVSGRDKGLIQDAIKEYALPVPDYAVGDVGATIYEIKQGQWQYCQDWEQYISSDWNGFGREQLESLFSEIDTLQRQEDEKQNSYKLSYYVSMDSDKETLLEKMSKQLEKKSVKASLIWSIDEEKNVGLLDVLPLHATKYHAIQFLMSRHDFSEDNCVFAGDSGNDLPVLISGLQSVLVRNASDEVRNEAISALKSKGLEKNLYLARGDFMGLNGNYSAGVTEGLLHFIPQARKWRL